MIISKKYSFNGGEEFIKDKYPHLLVEIEDVIKEIDAESCRLKIPNGAEKKRLKPIHEEKLYSPRHLNILFDYLLLSQNWSLRPLIKTNDIAREGTREMDALKEKLGVEIQFGKYAFLTYDIVAKMVIFKKLGIIDSGIEICPMASMLPHLSSGIGAYEQVVWDLDQRGAIKDFDVPVLIIGIETEKTHKARLAAKPRKARSHESQIYIERHSEFTESKIALLKETGVKYDA